MMVCSTYPYGFKASYPPTHKFILVFTAFPFWKGHVANFYLFFVDDFPKPQIRIHPETTVALRGVNVTLTCKAVSSSDLPISAAWRKDSEILYDADIENYVRYQQQDGEILEYTSILHVFNVNFTDEGKYQCIIFNHFGSNYSNKAKLTINGMQQWGFCFALF